MNPTLDSESMSRLLPLNVDCDPQTDLDEWQDMVWPPNAHGDPAPLVPSLPS